MDWSADLSGDEYESVLKEFLVVNQEGSKDPRKDNSLKGDEIEAIREEWQRVRKNKNSEYYLTDLVNIFSRNGLKVSSIPIKDGRKFVNINTFDDYQNAHDIDKMFIYEECIKNDIFLKDPNTFQKDFNVKIHKNVFIGPNVILKGNTEIKVFKFSFSFPYFCEVPVFPPTS